MIAVLIDGVTQPPVVVQCPQPVPESWLKWLLPTIVQTVVSLVSIGVGVGIAVWSFRRNRESEREQWIRNQDASHNQWLRDQKRADWRELLRQFSRFGTIVPPVAKMGVNYTEAAEQMLEAIQRAEEAYANCLFLEDYFTAKGNRDFVSEFLVNAARAADRILSPEHKILLSRSDSDRLAVANERSNLFTKLRIDYVDFMTRLQREARENISPSLAVAGANE